MVPGTQTIQVNGLEFCFLITMTNKLASKQKAPAKKNAMYKSQKT